VTVGTTQTAAQQREAKILHLVKVPDAIQSHARGKDARQQSARQRVILYAAKSETSSNTWKLRVIREASLSLCLVDSLLSVSSIAARKSANVG
jgi:hypothetical protein